MPSSCASSRIPAIRRSSPPSRASSTPSRARRDFLGLKRLEAIAQAAEEALSRGGEGSFALIEALAQIKHLIQHLAAHGEEPQGDDTALLAHLKRAPQPQLAEPAPAIAPLALPNAALLPAKPARPPAPISAQAQREAIRHGLETPSPTISRRALLEKLAWAVGELIALRQQLKAKGDETLAAPIQKLGALTRTLADALRGSQGPQAPGLEVVALLPVETGAAKLALPERYVLELLDRHALGNWRIETVFNVRVLLAGERVVPLVSLAELLKVEAAREDSIAIVKVGEAEFALSFATLGEPEEAVQRKLPALLSRLPLYRGCVQLGGATPLLVLDPAGIARSIGFRDVADLPPVAAPKPAVGEALLKPASFLLFRAGGGALKALRLEDVSRIDAIGAPREHMRIATLPGTERPNIAELVVLTGVEGQRIGIAVEQVVDVVEAPVKGHRLDLDGIEAEVIDVARLREVA
ncbi:MAG: chemotaxis protein CheW [Alphaproteobacteria bacterium]